MVEQSSEEENYKDAEQPKSPEVEAPPAEEQDYQEAAKSTADYADYEKPQKQRNPIWKKLSIGLAALVLIAALAAGGYWFYKNRKSTDKPSGDTQTTQPTAQAADTITTETKKYESANFKLSFDYPGNWFAGEDNAEEISVLSTDLKLKGVDGQDVVGQILLRIQAKGQKLSIGDPGSATAVLPSERITYANPTEVQRASTFITFVRYAQNTKGLDGIYITGDLGYEKDQQVPSSDVEKVDPVISIELYLCPNSGCVEVSGVYGISEEVWNDEDISVPLTNMLESFVIN